MKDDFRPIGPKPAPTTKQTPQNITSPSVATTFETPEQASERDQTLISPYAPEAPLPHEQPRGTGHHWFNLPWPPTRVEIAAVGSVLLLTIVSGAFLLFHHSTAVTPTARVVTAQKAAPKTVAPTTVASTLSGLPVSADVNNRPVVGVMVENSTAARPQAGLSQAGVVFEAVAEGGITRYLALYQDQQPSSVGPIRSARPYYVQWNEGFRAAYAHVGGSPDALNDIKSWGVQDLNQFYNPGSYHRLSSRPSPHNMYASISDLTNLATSKGYKSQFSGFARKASAPGKTPTATSIDFNISSALYNPHYAYDAKSNSYLRSEAGSAQTDMNTGTQLAPSVVIAIVVPLSSGSLDAQKSAYSNYNPIGSGTAYIFQDGSVTTATWHKPSNTAQISFNDAGGAVVPLDPGQTWISAVAAGSKVSYK